MMVPLRRRPSLPSLSITFLLFMQALLELAYVFGRIPGINDNTKLQVNRRLFDYSIVISTYNRGKNLARLVKYLDENVRKDVEIIVVDDASNEENRKYINRIKNISRVRLITHSKNLGAFHAKLHGFQAANTEYILSIDDDDWCDAGYHNEIIKNIEPQYDFISIKNHPFHMYFAIQKNITKWIESYHNNHFMAFRRSLLNNVNWPQEDVRIRRDDAPLMIPLYMQSTNEKIKIFDNKYRYVLGRVDSGQMSTYRSGKNQKEVVNGRDFVAKEAKRMGRFEELKGSINLCWNNYVDFL